MNSQYSVISVKKAQSIQLHGVTKCTVANTMHGSVRAELGEGISHS